MAILVISYEYGSRGEEIGHAIEKILGYDYIALGTILREARQCGGKWERFGRDYGDVPPNIWERYDWSFMGFMALVQSTILAHALKDNVVIMARGATYLLGGVPHALRVRVEAPAEKRIDWLKMKEEMSTEAAELLVRQADWEITSVIHQLYGKKWDDPDAYEIKFDTSTQGMDQIVDVVVSLLGVKNNLKTKEAQENLAMRALAAKIKAEIFTNPDFLIPTLEIEIQGGEIVLHGVARSIREHKAIDQIVQKLSGYTPVTCRIHYRGIKSVKPHRLR